VVHKRVSKVYEEVTAPDGTKFQIRETGQTWTLFYDVGQGWKRVQSSVDAKILHQIMMNQKELNKRY
jgi:hypothetical protein